MAQIIRKKLEEGCDQIYLVDTSGAFPIIRLKPIKHLLQKLIVFQPKTLVKEALLLDDLNIQVLTQNSILLIDDIFRHTNLKDQNTFHLNSYVLALIKSISRTIDFPVIITNQARSFDNSIRPFLQSLTLQYLDCHFLFEKTKDPNKIVISFFDRDQYVLQYEHSIDSSGFLRNF